MNTKLLEKGLEILKVFRGPSRPIELCPDMEATEAQTQEALQGFLGDPNYRTRKSGLDDQHKSEPQIVMDTIKILRDAGLARIFDHEHKPISDLFWACLDGGTVELTEAGKYYWRRAVNEG